MAIITQSELTNKVLGDLLSSAGVDYNIDNDNSIWIECLEYPFWIDVVKHDEEPSQLRFITYQHLKDGVTSAELSACVDTLNSDFILCQFYSFYECKQLRCSYSLLSETGIDEAYFLKMVETFPRIFHTVVHESNARLLLRQRDGANAIASSDKPSEGVEIGTTANGGPTADWAFMAPVND